MYFVSEAWHTCKAKLYECAAVVTCQAHALGSGRDNKVVSELRLWFCRFYKSQVMILKNLWSSSYDFVNFVESDYDFVDLMELGFDL